MIKTRILYIGNSSEISATMYRLLNSGDTWYGEICTVAEAVDFCAQNAAFDIVLLGCGISEQEEENLRSFFAQKYPKSKIILHYGGGSGLLSNEILEALAKHSN